MLAMCKVNRSLKRYTPRTLSPESIGVLTRYCQRSLYSQLSLFLETLASDEKSPQDASTLYLKHVSITIDWLYRALPRAEVGEQTVERSGSDSIAVAIEPTVQPLFDMLFKLAIEYPSLGNNAAFSAFLWRSIIALYSAAPVRDREQMDIKLAAFIGRCIAHLHVQSLPTHRIAFLRAIVASWERFGSSLREHELALFDAIMMVDDESVRVKLSDLSRVHSCF